MGWINEVKLDMREIIKENSDAFNKLVEEFCKFGDIEINKEDIVTTCKDASEGVYSGENDNGDRRVDLNILKLDSFVTKYFSEYWKNEMNRKYSSTKIDEFNAVDGIYIGDNHHWYFIEFKPDARKKYNDNLKQKILCSLWMIYFVLYQNNSDLLPDNFIDFSIRNITYIVVYRDDCTYVTPINIAEKSNHHFTPGYLMTYPGFTFSDAYIVTAKCFRNNISKIIKNKETSL